MGIEISGYYPPDAPVDMDCNPSGQSCCVDLGTKVMICRDIEKSTMSVKDALELKVAKRKLSTQIHSKYLPDYTQEASFVVLEGTNNGAPTKILGRYVDKVYSIRPASEIPLREVFSNPLMCRDILKISLQKINMIVSEGLIDDRGVLNTNSSKGIISKFLLSGLTDANTFFGTDAQGKHKCIIDADMFFKPEQTTLGTIINRIKRVGFHARNALVFGLFSVIHAINTSLISRQKNRIGNSAAI